MYSKCHSILIIKNGNVAQTRRLITACFIFESFFYYYHYSFFLEQFIPTFSFLVLCAFSNKRFKEHGFYFRFVSLKNKTNKKARYYFQFFFQLQSASLINAIILLFRTFICFQCHLLNNVREILQLFNLQFCIFCVVIRSTLIKTPRIYSKSN